LAPLNREPIWYVWPNYTIPGSYSGEIGDLNTWLTARIAWMDGQFNP
jgi:hypothetical protein